jgi:hypothetical protein
VRFAPQRCSCAAKRSHRMTAPVHLHALASMPLALTSRVPAGVLCRRAGLRIPLSPRRIRRPAAAAEQEQCAREDCNVARWRATEKSKGLAATTGALEENWTRCKPTVADGRSRSITAHQSSEFEVIL